MKKALSKRRKLAKKSDATADFEALLEGSGAEPHYVLRLFITGTTPRSALAISNIRSLCDEYLQGNYDLEVIDIYQQPTAAVGEQIIAAPTLIKKSPIPIRRMIGDLSNRMKVMAGLDLKNQDVSDIELSVKAVPSPA